MYTQFTNTQASLYCSTYNTCIYLMPIIMWSLTATNFFFPKKHIPMLFHSCGLSGDEVAAIRYLERATSKSPWSCIIDPAARMALVLVRSKVSAPPSRSNALLTWPTWRWRRPSVVRSSGASGLSLMDDLREREREREKYQQYSYSKLQWQVLWWLILHFTG